MGEVILDVKNLKTRFRVRSGHVYAVNGVSFQVRRGETLGVVGESGCGKSVTMMSILKLLPPASEVQAGEAIFHGEDLLKMNRRQLQKVRGGKIGMIFQDPMTSFNPVLTMGDQLGEPLIYHRHASAEQARHRTMDMLTMVGIPDPTERLSNYPHQFSGGMRQRSMIAMALTCEPDLVIADEPTTALDVTIQAQIVELVKDLRDRLGVAIIWITHDLSLVAGLADRIMVMYGGTIVEEGKTEDIFDDPRHPYTLGLLMALPAYQAEKNQKRLVSIPGSPPDLRQPPSSCPFVNRCAFAIDRCKTEIPTLQPALEGSDPNHRLACWVDTRGKSGYILFPGGE
jgi:oligopeptide/dipeptide ABC transporter ATP-binding protein